MLFSFKSVTFSYIPIANVASGYNLSFCSVTDMVRRNFGSLPLPSTSSLHHNLTSSKGFRCQFCSKSYAAKQDLEGHVNAQHLNCKPYQCPVCSKAFAYEKTLKCHVRMSHSDGFVCY